MADITVPVSVVVQFCYHRKPLFTLDIAVRVSDCEYYALRHRRYNIGIKMRACPDKVISEPKSKFTL